MIEYIIKNIYLFSTAALLAIGSFYDERLVIYEINITVIISIFYTISSLFLLLKTKYLSFNVSKFVLYLFMFLTILITPINWIIYGLNDYSLIKYISFALIVIPICYISIEVLKKEDMNKFIWIFVGVSSMLMLIGFMSLGNISDLDGGRMSVMGGGPIVFSRWMMIAVLIIFFNKNKYSKFLYLLIPLFLFMSFTAGSRGPIYSFLIVIFFYFLFSFRKNFFKIILFSLVAILSILSLSLTENNKGVGSQSTSRVFNISTGSYSRIDRVDRSLNLVLNAPFGVGIGNWAQESNKLSDHQHEDKQYPHNIFLELVNESGIIVLLIFIILLITIFEASLSLLFYENRYYFLRLTFILFVYLFINSLVSGDIVDNRLMFIMLALFIKEQLVLNKGLDE